jgi:F-type H+-transporting ATPase subunit delta
MFSAPVQRRGYAEAVNDKIKLSLTLPHQVRSTDFGINISLAPWLLD